MLAGCGRQAPPAPERLAFVRFENLSADASADWMGRAFSEIIAAELPQVAIPASRLHGLNRTLGGHAATSPGISTERSAALLAGANRIGYGDYEVRGGRVEVRLSIEDVATGRDTRVLSASGADVLTVAADLARQISPRATGYETRNSEAVRDYILAIEGGNPAAVTQNASAAIAADPDYAPAYILLAGFRAQQHDRDGALTTLDQALARGSAIPDIERARLELDAATLRNDYAGRERALAALAKANPGDSDSWRALGEAAYGRHDYPQAVEAFRSALRLAPDDPTTLNLFGYAQAYTGDLEGAANTFRRYRSLRPNDPNPIDSMGDVLLLGGRPREAAGLYIEADQKDRKLLGGGDLLKAAIARLLAGDASGASEMARQYADARAAVHDPGVPVFQEAWTWLAGNPKAAAAQLESFARATEAGPQKEIASHAYADLAVWSLLAGDRAAAAQLSLKAAALASPASAGDAIMARFLSQPSAGAAEWTARADQLFRSAPPELKDLTLGRALLLDHQFAAAVPVLRRAYAGPTTDPSLPVLLAWAMIEAGQKAEAAPLLRFTPIPPYAGIDPFTGLAFARLNDLRARLAK